MFLCVCVRVCALVPKLAFKLIVYRLTAMEPASGSQTVERARFVWTESVLRRQENLRRMRKFEG